MIEKYSKLFTLFCGYFGQSWKEGNNTAEAIIHAFAENGNKERIKESIDELTLLLKEVHKKEEWYQLMTKDFGCPYDLKSQNIDPVEWLKKVQLQLEAELKLAEAEKVADESELEEESEIQNFSF